MRIGGWGLSPTGKWFRFVSFVRACARSGCRVEFSLKRPGRSFSFPFMRGSLSLFPSESTVISNEFQ